MLAMPPGKGTQSGIDGKDLLSDAVSNNDIDS